MHNVRRLPGGGLQHAVRGGYPLKPGRRLWHPTVGRSELIAPDGSVLWQGPWMENVLHDQGEESILNVYFRDQTRPSTYLFLLNQADTSSIAESAELGDLGTSLTETETPGQNGYARQEIPPADFGAPVLDDGDYMTTAAQKTFGPNSSGSSWFISHTALGSAATGNTGILIVTIPVGASKQEVIDGISFRHTIKVKAA